MRRWVLALVRTLEIPDEPPKKFPWECLENRLALGRSRADDGLYGSYPSKPDRTITSGLPTNRELAYLAGMRAIEGSSAKT
jgi:hypothetical protein